MYEFSVLFQLQPGKPLTLHTAAKCHWKIPIWCSVVQHPEEASGDVGSVRPYNCAVKFRNDLCIA